MIPGVLSHLFAGISKGGVAITLATSYNVSHSVIDPANAYAEFRLESDGDIHEVEFTDADVGDWMTPKGGAPSSGYEVRATKNSGTDPAGSALATWLVLSSNRNWNLTQSVIGSKTCNLTVEIRDAVSLAVLDSASVDITATVDI